MKRRKVTACAMAALMAMGLVGTVMPVYAKSNLKNVDDVVEIKGRIPLADAQDYKIIVTTLYLKVVKNHYISTQD